MPVKKQDPFENELGKFNPAEENPHPTNDVPESPLNEAEMKARDYALDDDLSSGDGVDEAEVVGEGDGDQGDGYKMRFDKEEEEDENEEEDEPEEHSKEDKDAFDATAEMFTDILCHAIPEVSHAFSKISEREVRQKEERGLLFEGTTKEIVKRNRENRKLFEIKEREKRFIERPLKQLCEEKALSLRPEHQLIVGLIVILFGQFMVAREVSASNKHLIEEMEARMARHRAEMQRNQPPPAQPKQEDQDVEVLEEVESA